MTASTPAISRAPPSRDARGGDAAGGAGSGGGAAAAAARPGRRDAGAAGAAARGRLGRRGASAGAARLGRGRLDPRHLGQRRRGDRREVLGHARRPSAGGGGLGQEAEGGVGVPRRLLAEQVVGDRARDLRRQPVRGRERGQAGVGAGADRLVGDPEHARRSRRRSAPAGGPARRPRAGRGRGARAGPSAPIKARPPPADGSRPPEAPRATGPVRVRPREHASAPLARAARLRRAVRPPDPRADRRGGPGGGRRPRRAAPAGRARARRRLRLDRRVDDLHGDLVRGPGPRPDRPGPVQPDELPAPDRRRHDPRGRPPPAPRPHDVGVGGRDHRRPGAALRARADDDRGPGRGRA